MPCSFEIRADSSRLCLRYSIICVCERASTSISATLQGWKSYPLTASLLLCGDVPEPGVSVQERTWLKHHSRTVCSADAETIAKSSSCLKVTHRASLQSRPNHSLEMQAGITQTQTCICFQNHQHMTAPRPIEMLSFRGIMSFGGMKSSSSMNPSEGPVPVCDLMGIRVTIWKHSVDRQPQILLKLGADVEVISDPAVTVLPFFLHLQ